jgi:flagellar hook-length control protein FliK
LNISNINLDAQSNLVRDNKTPAKDYKESNLNNKDTFSKVLSNKSNEKKQQCSNEKNINSTSAKDTKPTDKATGTEQDKEKLQSSTLPSENEEVVKDKTLDDKPAESNLSDILNTLLQMMNNESLNPEVKTQLKEFIDFMVSSGAKVVTDVDISNKISNFLKIKEGNKTTLESMVALLTQSENEPLDKSIESILPSLKNLLTSKELSKDSLVEPVSEKPQQNTIENVLSSKIREMLLSNKAKGEVNPPKAQFTTQKEEVVQNSFSTEVKPPNKLFEDSNSKSGVVEKDFFKESNILDKLIEGDKADSKVSRTTNLITALGDNRFSAEINNIAKDSPIFLTKTNLNEDLIKAIKFMNVNNIKDLSVKIYPKELGEVVISVTMEQGSLKAMIKATNKDTVDLLNFGLRDLNDKLTTNNIKIESLDIGLYNEDTTFFSKEGNRGQEQQSQESSNKKYSFEIEEDKPVESQRDDGTVNILI